MRQLGGICSRQYVVSNQTALEARERVGPSQWIDVEYDDLVASPVETTRSLFERLGLLFSREVADTQLRCEPPPDPRP